MSYSLAEIIKNQKEFKDKILFFYKKDFQYAKQQLSEINCKDVFIQKQKKKLESNFKKYKPIKYVERFFFLHPKRDLNYYVWWNDVKQEPCILNYNG